MFYFSQRSTLSNHPVFSFGAQCEVVDGFLPYEAPKIFRKPRRILVPVAVLDLVLCRVEVPDFLEKLVLLFEPYLIDIC